MRLYNITPQQTSVLKAIGIILIAFHNFLYWTNDIGCNELQLDTGRVSVLLGFIKENPLNIIDAFFSFLGHYGVQIFIFASGYGLCKQFIKRRYRLTLSSYTGYLKYRLVKIYALLLFGIVICSVFFIDEMKGYLYSMFLLLVGLRNFSYSTVFGVIGPWWYFGLAVQLYIIFPFLYGIIDKKGKRGFYILLLISYLLIYLLWTLFEKLRIPVFGIFIGHLPEFLLGIAFARIHDLKLDVKIFVAAVLVFIFSNKFQAVFPLSFLSMTVISIFLIYKIIGKIPEKIYSGLIFIGSISMFIFLINGPIRSFAIYNIVRPYNLNPLFSSLINFIVVVIISYILSLLYGKLRSLLKQIKIQI